MIFVYAVTAKTASNHFSIVYRYKNSLFYCRFIYTRKIGHTKHLLILVRVAGLEPASLSAIDFKSISVTNFDTLA